MSQSFRKQRLAKAVEKARDTREVLIESGAIAHSAELFQKHFGTATAVIVADTHTFPVAGQAVFDTFKRSGVPLREAFIFADPDLYAEHRFVERLQDSLATNDAVPVAVGSGTINDVTKLAAHRTDRQYVSIATAASMDGYTAYGSSITFEGSKQTFDCPAPRVVVADLDVVTGAPAALGASGYADLIAKVTAGADWIVADALGIEPINTYAWELVQDPLRSWLENPAGVGSGNPQTIANLLEGLMMSGLAMQSTMSSRPASGAEHQFSHLWDMQHHTHNGGAPSHGFKVGVATAAIGELYTKLLRRDLAAIDVDGCLSRWPALDEINADIERRFDDPAIRDKAILEMSEKYISLPRLRAELETVKTVWRDLKARLDGYLMTGEEFRQRLSAAGAPCHPEEIGISRDRLAQSHRLAYYIRRRYTVLDLCVRCNLLDELVPAS